MFRIKTIGWILPGIMFISTSAHAAVAPFATDSPWMLGDWQGERSKLQQQGIDFNVNYVMESASNLAGGAHSSTTARYTDQWMFNTHLDLQKLLGWQDTDFQATITDRNGQNLSEQVADSRHRCFPQCKKSMAEAKLGDLRNFGYAAALRMTGLISK